LVGCCELIQFKIILPSTPGSSMQFPFPRLTHQKPIYTTLVHHTCHMPSPSHSSRFDHQDNSWWGIKIMNLLTVQSRVSSYCSPLQPKHLPPHPTLKHPQPTFFLLCERPSFIHTQNNWQNHSSVYFDLHIFGHRYLINYAGM